MSAMRTVWHERRRQFAAAGARRRRARGAREAFAGRVRGDLAAELPDEDLGEDLVESLDLYRMGSKPRCEEVEYLDLVQEAVERMAWGR
ncbi:hypothetical protein OG946_22685 [Streptomyces sp. NBC_01808]|uniref:hypothetical protein n=1 Tax=Streptomyces sp. NBC_01808 TaxID=2975947 RepID=UPI002DDB9854|nr:hypothetical protein [Streptomyces sp. NBC_01808]WSA39927.1 hypothetical protein OG946_22685 [Streptomyces sp. NBC_01808]